MGMRAADARCIGRGCRWRTVPGVMIGKSLSDAAVKSADLRVRLGAVCHLISVF
jgi:hypothetical protein